MVDLIKKKKKKKHHLLIFSSEVGFLQFSKETISPLHDVKSSLKITNSRVEMEGFAHRNETNRESLRDLFFTKLRQLKSSVIFQRRRRDYALRRGSLQLKQTGFVRSRFRLNGKSTPISTFGKSEIRRVDGFICSDVRQRRLRSFELPSNKGKS